MGMPNHKTSKYAQSLHMPNGISKEDENFIKTACGVPDATYPYTGVPDKQTGPNVVRHSVQQLELDMSKYATTSSATNCTQVQIVLWPWDRQEQLTRCNINFENRITVDPNIASIHSLNTGGLGVYVLSDAAPSIFDISTTSDPINVDPVNGTPGQTLNPSDTFLQGENGRKVGAWYEIFYEGPEAYASGSAVDWQVDQQPDEADYRWYGSSDGTATPCGTMGQATGNNNPIRMNAGLPQLVTRYPLPVSSASQAQLFYDSVNWQKITDGNFVPAKMYFEDNNTSYPGIRAKILDGNTPVTQASGSGAGEYNGSTQNSRNTWAVGQGMNDIIKLGSATEDNSDKYSGVRNYVTNQTMKGTILTNLNNGLSQGAIAQGACRLKILYHTVWEFFPDGSNELTVSMQQRSPAYNPEALDAFYRIMESMPIAYPLSWNKKETFLKQIIANVNQIRNHLVGKNYRALPPVFIAKPRSKPQKAKSSSTTTTVTKGNGAGKTTVTKTVNKPKQKKSVKVRLPKKQ